MISKLSPSYHPHFEPYSTHSPPSHNRNSQHPQHTRHSKYSNRRYSPSHRYSQTARPKNNSNYKQSGQVDSRRKSEERKEHCFKRKRGSNFSKMLTVQSIQVSKFEEAQKKLKIKTETEGDKTINKNDADNLIKITSIKSVKVEATPNSVGKRQPEIVKTNPNP